jgi:hypothetical protein
LGAPSTPRARLDKSVSISGSVDRSAAATATASVTAATACSPVTFSSRITPAAAMESCAGGMTRASMPSMASSRPVAAMARRYATTEPGPLAAVRDSKRATTSSHISSAASSRMYASCFTKLSRSASAASSRPSRRSALRLAGMEASHARTGEGTSLARPEGSGAPEGASAEGEAALASFEASFEVSASEIFAYHEGGFGAPAASAASSPAASRASGSVASSPSPADAPSAFELARAKIWRSSRRDARTRAARRARDDAPRARGAASALGRSTADVDADIVEVRCRSALPSVARESAKGKPTAPHAERLV